MAATERRNVVIIGVFLKPRFYLGLLVMGDACAATMQTEEDDDSFQPACMERVHTQGLLYQQKDRLATTWKPVWHAGKDAEQCGNAHPVTLGDPCAQHECARTAAAVLTKTYALDTLVSTVEYRQARIPRAALAWQLCPVEKRCVP
jgi:hypothetical protein